MYIHQRDTNLCFQNKLHPSPNLQREIVFVFVFNCNNRQYFENKLHPSRQSQRKQAQHTNVQLGIHWPTC